MSENQQPARTDRGQTRRGFLGGVALAASAAASLDTSRTAHAAGSDLIKIGLVGCGGRGTGATAEALSTKGPVKLVAVADVFEEKAEAALQRLQANGRIKDRIDVPPQRRFIGFDGCEKVLESGVDLVILACPPGFRPIHFEAAVRAGKHVFMEKPVAVDGPGVRKVLEANRIAKEKGLCVGVGLQRHHQFPYIETINRLRDGLIGDIYLARVYWNGGGVWPPRKKRSEVKTEMEYQLWNWYYYTWLSGDHIVEQHIHNIDVINWLKGTHPVRCQGQGGRQVRTGKEYGQIYDHHFIEFEYADGTRMYSQCRHIPGCWDSVSEHVHGSKGECEISAARAMFADGKTWQYKGPMNNPYQTEHDELFEAIRKGLNYNEADYAATSTMTAIMGRMATYSGKLVTWDEAINSQLALVPDRYAWDGTPPVLPDEEGRYPVPMPGQTRAF